MSPAAKVALVVGALGIALTASAQTPTPKSDKLESAPIYSGSTTALKSECGLAQFGPPPERTVTIDWKCVDEFADGPFNADASLVARMLKAVRDGKAISK